MDRTLLPADLPELLEDVELDDERKRRILTLHGSLGECTHYELLELPFDADKKAIKAAYYKLAPEFHPDRYFRKQLGSYKAKIEALFSRLTVAHDVLTSKTRRAEYDEYIAQTRRNRALEDALSRAAAPPTAPASEPSPPPPVSVQPTQAPMERADLDRLRREALARKLGARPPPRGAASARPSGPGRPGRAGATSSMAPRRPPPAPGPQSPPDGDRSELPAEGRALVPETARSAGEALKARYDAARAGVRQQQLDRYLELGRASAEQGDLAGAANALQIAASMAPDDADLQSQAQSAQTSAAAALADGYARQAEYEASHGQWAEAALSFAKVCKGRPEDALAHERVAFATVASGGNVRRAVEFARRAVELDSSLLVPRLTLARAYDAAGFDKSALAELERARELAPGDARIRELQERLGGAANRAGKLS